MYKNIRGLATNVEYIVIIIIRHRVKDVVLINSSSFCMKPAMDVSFISGNLFRMKSDFALSYVGQLKSGIC